VDSFEKLDDTWNQNPVDGIEKIPFIPFFSFLFVRTRLGCNEKK
jgi:hypothetical protein